MGGGRLNWGSGLNRAGGGGSKPSWSWARNQPKTGVFRFQGIPAFGAGMPWPCQAPLPPAPGLRECGNVVNMSGHRRQLMSSLQGTLAFWAQRFPQRCSTPSPRGKCCNMGVGVPILRPTPIWLFCTTFFNPGKGQGLVQHLGRKVRTTSVLNLSPKSQKTN